MEFLVEIIFRWLIVRTLGLYSRFAFFKIVGNTKTTEQLLGNSNVQNEGLSQDFYNAFIGLIVFCALSITIAYLIFSN